MRKILATLFVALVMTIIVADARPTQASISSYNPTCDGVTDTTAQFQNALNSGANIFVDAYPSSCVVRTLTMSTAGQQLIVSSGATLFLKSGTTAPMITVSCNSCQILGGNYNGNRSGQGAAVYGQGLINVTSASNVKVLGTVISNTYSGAIEFVTSPYGEAGGNTLDLIYGAAIQFYTNSHWGNAHDNIITRPGSDGIAGQGNSPTPACGCGSEHVTIQNNRVDYTNTTVWNSANSAVGLSLWGSSDHGLIAGNTVNGPTSMPAGFQSWCAAVSASSDHSSIDGNTCKGGTTFGIEASDTSFNSIVGNTVDGMLSTGIDVPGSGAFGTLTIGNTVSANNIRGVPIGIEVIGTSISTGVVGNTVIDASGVGIGVLKGADPNGPTGSSVVANLITSYALPLGTYQAIGVSAADVIVSSNQMKWQKDAPGGNSGGFYVILDALRLSVTNNVLANGVGVSAPAFQETANGGRSNFSGNSVYLTSGFMIDNSASVAGNNLVNGNMCESCGGMLNGAPGDVTGTNKLN